MSSPALDGPRRRRAPPPAQRLGLVGDLSAYLRAKVTDLTRLRWPSERYRARPVEFFREILGVEPWHKQIEIIEAVRDHDRVAVASGHKVSKSHTATGLALWWYCSFDDARAVMTSTTSRQVDQILWRELMMIRARSGRCVVCRVADPDGLVIKRPCPHSALIDGELGTLARTGLKSDDFREIVGFTAREPEAIAGISGRNVLYIGDEASGIPDPIFEGIEGNRAGGAKLALFGNPTRNEGEFFEAFHSKSRLYKTIHVSSEETPNVVEGRVVIPGLATREWIDEKRDEWGETSPLYLVRVKGRFATNEQGRIFNLHTIRTAEIRWYDTTPAGRLFIGIDPAGETGTGDEWCFAPRRGLKVFGLYPFAQLNNEQALVQLLGFIATHALPRETPVVVIDREGSVGAKFTRVLRDYLDKHPAAFELATVRASDGARRQAHLYGRVRDELAANLERWFRDGGSIPEDAKLVKELHALQWKQELRGRFKLTPKEILRKLLGRSPDRYDSLALSVWEPLSLTAEDDVPAAVRSAAAGDHGAYAENTMDPYAGGDIWR